MNNLAKHQERPWGNYSILFESEFCKVKIISVNPSQRLSYQFHEKRSEAWTIVSGTGKITLDGNHPLCNIKINFDVNIVNIRDASTTEINALNEVKED